MFKLKLKALDYPSAETANINNVREYRSIVLWLEDQKIRQYKIENRERLRKLDSDDWPKAYDQYKEDIGCPILSKNSLEELQWILSYAVQLEYSDTPEKYNKKSVNKVKTTPNVVTTNPLDKLDFQSAEFKNGISALAKVLKVTPHPNHLVTLKAIRKLVCKRLSVEALQKPENVIVKGVAFPYNEMSLGFDLGDPVLNQAAKILRLLHIQDLRQLQTQINELIVAVQNVTANPKTDTKLGKVGI